MTVEYERLKTLTELRRTLHSHPDLSGREGETCSRLRSFLEHCGPDDIVMDLGGGGLAVIYRGNEPGPDLMFRAETDALPIREEALFPHASLRAGISHKCGHDGHMSILAGVAASVGKKRIRRGRLILLFQPAEETGTGALAVLDDPKFTSLVPDYVFALHNWPGFPCGSIAVRSGTAFAASTGITLELTGKSAHAMAPEEGLSPVNGIKAIHTQLEKLCHPDRLSEEFRMITTVGIRVGGEDFGVSPGTGSLHLTARAYRQELLDDLVETLCARARGIAEEEGLGIRFRFQETFPSSVNDPSCVAIVRKAAGDAGLPLVEPEQGRASSEDVGHLFRASRRGGAILLLGSGEDGPPLHAWEYDFDDTLIEPGVRLYLHIADELLGLEA